VRKALSAPETEAQSAPTGITIRQGPRDVGDAGALIVEHYPQACPLLILDHFELRGASASIIESIAGQLARSRNQLGLID
jgi:hypothetical protein